MLQIFCFGRLVNHQGRERKGGGGGHGDFEPNSNRSLWSWPFWSGAHDKQLAKGVGG